MSNIRTFGSITPDIAHDAWVDESAVIIGNVHIGSQSSVWPNTVIRGDVHQIRIGNESNIQDGCVLHVSHDSQHLPGGAPLELSSGDITRVRKADIPCQPEATNPSAGTILSYTVIYERKRPDLAVILGETASGERFLANSAEPGLVESLQQAPPIGRQVQVSATERGNSFSLVG